MQIQQQQSIEGPLIFARASLQFPDVLKAVHSTIRDEVRWQGREKRLSLTHCQINSVFARPWLVFSEQYTESPASRDSIGDGWLVNELSFLVHFDESVEPIHKTGLNDSFALNLVLETAAFVLLKRELSLSSISRTALFRSIRNESKTEEWTSICRLKAKTNLLVNCSKWLCALLYEPELNHDCNKLYYEHRKWNPK